MGAGLRRQWAWRPLLGQLLGQLHGFGRKKMMAQRRCMHARKKMMADACHVLTTHGTGMRAREVVRAEADGSQSISSVMGKRWLMSQRRCIHIKRYGQALAHESAAMPRMRERGQRTAERRQRTAMH